VGVGRRALRHDALKRLWFRGALLCLRQDTGELDWQMAFDVPVKPGGRSSRYGLCSPPVVEGNRLYLVTAGGVAVCMDVEGMANGNDGPFQDELKGERFQELTEEQVEDLRPGFGDIIWFRDIVGEFDIRLHDAYAGRVLLHGDHLWIPTSHAEGETNDLAYLCPGKEVLRKGPRKNMVVLDKNTGEVIAVDDLTVHEVYHGQWSSPTLGVVDGKDQVYYGDGYGILHAFEPPDPGVEGVQMLETIWSYDANPRDYRFKDGYEILYEGPRGDTVGQNDGPSEIISKAVFHKGRVYCAIGRDDRASWPEGHPKGMLHCIDPTLEGDVTGRATLWTARIGRTMCTPVIKDDMLFIGDFTGMFYCFDATTGEKLWEHELDSYMLFSSAIVADGKVYLGTRRGQFYVFAAAHEKQLLHKLDTRADTVTPTAVDGMVFAPNMRYLRAYSGPGHKTGR
jgi:outer membrane protein assembly factor BamB